MDTYIKSCGKFWNVNFDLTGSILGVEGAVSTDAISCLVHTMDDATIMYGMQLVKFTVQNDVMEPN